MYRVHGSGRPRRAQEQAKTIANAAQIVELPARRLIGLRHRVHLLGQAKPRAKQDGCLVEQPLIDQLFPQKGPRQARTRLELDFITALTCEPAHDSGEVKPATSRITRNARQ